VAASPDNATLASFSRSLTARVHDLRTGALRRSWRPHRAPVADACVDSSGGYLATASADRSVKVWDLDTGLPTHHLQGHSGVVLRVLFHPRRPLLFSADDQGEVRVWSLVAGGGGSSGNGRCLAALSGQHLSAVTSLAVAPDGWRLLSGSRDKTVHVWDLRRALEAVAGAGGGSAAASSSRGKKRGKDSHSQQPQLDFVTKLSAIPVFEAVEGLVVLPAGSPFPGVADADAAARRQQAEAAASSSPAASAAARPMVFATAGEKGVVRLWRTDTGKCVGTQAPPWQHHHHHHHAAQQGLVENAPQQPAPAGHELTELVLVPGGRELCAASGDCRLLFLGPQRQSSGDGGAAPSAAAAAPPAKPALHLTRELVGNHDEVTDLRFVGDPANPSHLAVATNGDVLRTFSLDASRGGSAAARCVGHAGPVLALDAARLSDGRDLLASGGRDCEVRVWDADAGACLGVGRGHIGAVSAVALSRKGGGGGGGFFLASAGADRLLKIWDLSPVVGSRGWQQERLGKEGGEQEEEEEEQEKEEKMEGGDGKAATTTATPTTAAARRLRALAAVAAHEKDVNSVAVSPNDLLVATASQDRTAKIWRLSPTLSLACVLRGHKRGVWSVQFSPVDQAVLTSSGDRTVKLWGIPGAASSSGLVAASCLRTFEGHGAGVLRALFVTAGTQVVSAGADGLLKLWNVRGGGGGRSGGGGGGGALSSSSGGKSGGAGECVATMDGHTDRVWALCSAGGPGRDALLASGGADAAVAVWRDATEARALEAADALARLSQREQALGNALADGRLAEAARLALELRHPGRLLAVLRRAGPRRADAALGALARRAAASARKQQAAGAGGASSLEPGDDTDLRVLLSYAREWNTNARNCHAAQALVRRLLQALPPAAMVEALGGGAAAAAWARGRNDDDDDSGSDGDDEGDRKNKRRARPPPPAPARDLVDGLLAYSERHFARVDRLLRATFLADYTLEAADVLVPEEEDGGEGEAEAEGEGEERRAVAAAPRQQVAAAANGNGAARAASPSLSLELDDVEDAEEEEEEAGGGGGDDGGQQWFSGSGSGSGSEEEDDDEDSDDEPAAAAPPPPRRGKQVAASAPAAKTGKRRAAPAPAARAPPVKRGRAAAAAAPATPAKRGGRRKAV
jgi:U3 small nucleolar RNA-associated protein 13